MAYERKRITQAEIPALIAFLDMCGHAHRKGKGPFQELQVQHQKGWGAICKNAGGDLSNDPDISGVISAYRAWAQSGHPVTEPVAQPEFAPVTAPAPDPAPPRGIVPITSKSIGMHSAEFMALLEDFAIQLAPALAAAVIASVDSKDLPHGKAGDLAAELTYRLASKMVAEHAKYKAREAL